VFAVHPPPHSSFADLAAKQEKFNYLNRRPVAPTALLLWSILHYKGRLIDTVVK
jgi:hypothetical protein